MVLIPTDTSLLEVSLQRWEWAEYASEAFVILGCVGEFVAEFTAVKTEAWRQQLGKISLLVLIAGLAVELTSLVRTNTLAGQEIAILNVTAAEARERAAAAEIRAAELRAVLADRALDADQQQKIGAALKPFSSHLVYIRSYPNDAEAARLIVQLEAALKLAHIDFADRRGELLQPGALVMGIRVEPGSNDRKFADELVKSLRLQGRLSVDDVTPFLSSTVTEVLVGVKPVVLANIEPGSASQSPRFGRHLSPAQLQTLVSKVRVSKTSGQYAFFEWSFNDTEISEFANDLVQSCCKGKGGWNCVVRDVEVSSPGVTVLVNPDANVKGRTAAEIVVTTLREDGVSVDGPRASPEASPFTVRIGARPR